MVSIKQIHFSKLNEHLKAFDETEEETQPSTQNNVSFTASTSSQLDANDSVELQRLQRKMGGGIRREGVYNSSSELWEQQLKAFCEMPRIIPCEGFNIREYWFCRRFEFPELYKLSQVALAVAPTQVDVERLFSALVLVLTHLRNRLQPETLNAILVLKMNLQLIDEIDFSQFN